MVIGGFAALTMLTKNSFLDQINPCSTSITARSKGLTERRVLYSHVFRNAMLIVIAGFPSAFISRPLYRRIADRGDLSPSTGSGGSGFESAFNRDYPVMFGTLFCLLAFGPGHAAGR